MDNVSIKKVLIVSVVVILLFLMAVFMTDRREEYKEKISEKSIDEIIMEYKLNATIRNEIYIEEKPNGIKEANPGTESKHFLYKFTKNNNTLGYSKEKIRCSKLEKGNPYKRCTLEYASESIDGTKNISIKFVGLVERNLSMNFDFNFSKEGFLDFKGKIYSFEISYSTEFNYIYEERKNVSYKWEKVIIAGKEYTNKTTYETVYRYRVKNYTNYQPLPKGRQGADLLKEYFKGDSPYHDPTISVCTSIDDAGIYELDMDIITDISPCMIINHDDVVLNGMEYKIEDITPNAMDLISFGGTFLNITIKNITLRGGVNGIQAGAYNSLFENISIIDTPTVGMYVEGESNTLRNIQGNSKIATVGLNFNVSGLNISTGGFDIPHAFYFRGSNLILENSSLSCASGNCNVMEIGGYEFANQIENITIRNVIGRGSGQAGNSGNFVLLMGNVTNGRIYNLTSINNDAVGVSIKGAFTDIQNLVINGSGLNGLEIWLQHSSLNYITIEGAIAGNAFTNSRDNVSIRNIMINGTLLGNGIYLNQMTDDLSIENVSVKNGNKEFFDLILNNPVGSGGNGEIVMESYYIENYTYAGSWKNKLSFWKMDKARIDFAQTINANGTNLTNDIKVETTNFAEVLEQTNTNLNKKANITFWNLPEGNKNNILKNHVNCTTCVNFTALDANPVRFSVEDWSNYTINITAGGIVTTCTYGGSGNYYCDCGANYTLTSNINLMKNNFTISGNGYFNVLANITNYTMVFANHTQSTRCNVMIKPSGGFRNR